MSTGYKSEYQYKSIIIMIMDGHRVSSKFQSNDEDFCEQGINGQILMLPLLKQSFGSIIVEKSYIWDSMTNITRNFPEDLNEINK